MTSMADVTVPAISYSAPVRWFRIPPKRALYVEITVTSHAGTANFAAVDGVQLYSPNLGGPDVAFDNLTALDGDSTLHYAWDFGPCVGLVAFMGTSVSRSYDRSVQSCMSAI